MRRAFKFVFSTIAVMCAGPAVNAQEFLSPANSTVEGTAPGMKVKLLSETDQTKTYVLIFKKEDELRAGLTEFAKTYNVKSAHYTGIGDALSAKFGIFNYKRKEFKVISVDSAEVASFEGNIVLYKNDPVAHTHASAAATNGLVYGGHLLQLIVGPTFEIFVTVEETPLYKKYDPEFDATIIAPELEN
ncbi:PPC domain-containing DNA-binding protein [Sinomicrobium sp. M5D2P17]